jgi:hypothetical protein
MKRISSYFAPAGEKRAKPTATDENQNEAITTNLENPSERGIEGQKKNESSGSVGVPAPRKFKIQIQTLLLTQTHQQDMVIAQLHKMYYITWCPLSFDIDP